MCTKPTPGTVKPRTARDPLQKMKRKIKGEVGRFVKVSLTEIF